MSLDRVRPRVLVVAAVGLAAGCAAPAVDFSKIQRPERDPALDAYDVFVGNWTWKAEMPNADEKNRSWTGTAEWNWTLDRRCLSGRLAASTADAAFEAVGIWSRHPKKGRYIWSMFNNWGYPQHGSADYDAATKSWTMQYVSIGLDGTESHGEYRLTVADPDTLTWSMHEWADALHLAKKMEMTGTYTRVK